MTTYHRSRLASACLLAALATLAACTTTPADPPAEAFASSDEALAPTGDAFASTAEPVAAVDKEVTALQDDEGIRCRRVTATGTHMSKRVCTTAAQRKQQREEAARLARGSQMAMDAARNQAAAARSAGRAVITP
ncbi:MAG: hypothetical protein AAFN78_05880 [Pseudomonadota bacterium]